MLVRSALLAAAREVFDERGLAAAHMADIADRAGVTKAHIYNFFRDKDQLFLEVHRAAAMRAVDALEARLLRVMSRTEKVQAIAEQLLEAAFRRDRARRLPLDLCERALEDPVLLDDLVEVRAALNERLRLVLVEAGLMDGSDSERGRRLMILLTSLLSYLPLAAAMEPSLREVEVLGLLVEALMGSPGTED